MKRILIFILTLSPFFAFAQTTLKQKIAPPYEMEGFGMDVDLDSKHMVITNGLEVFFYKRDTDNWQYIHSRKSRKKEWDHNDTKTSTVSISNGYVFFGIPDEDVMINGKTFKNAGAVYIYSYSDQNGGWREQAKLVSPEPMENGFFGDVDSYNSSVLVGSRGSNKSFLFNESENSGWKHYKPEDLDGNPHDLPGGISPTCKEEAMLVINSKKGEDGKDYPFIRMLDIGPGGWWRTQYFLPPNYDGTWNGSTDIDERHLVVAGHKGRSNTIDFYHYGDNWIHRQTEMVGSGSYGNYSVKVGGDIAMLSAPNQSFVQLYHYDVYQKGGRWMPLQRISKEDRIQFGHAIAIQEYEAQEVEFFAISSYNGKEGFVEVYELGDRYKKRHY